ncbi:flagellar protein FlaG [Desulfobacter vibrioformis]|uniref:flagellar protein FlaG n=1 Tax=Desulfobacter vibrioformis TaxID=34031 RepID=UPI000557DB93|nr:flagellar protein FlaG [Desulfobacter vibrioformis]
MDVTAKAISHTDRPETSTRIQETATETVSADIPRLSQLKQAASSSASSQLNESQASEQKNEDPGNSTELTQLTKKDVEEMVDAFEDFANTVQTRLNFTIDDSTEDMVVKIMDKETNEVIKQFPAEEILELREKMQDLRGLLFSTNV